MYKIETHLHVSEVSPCSKMCASDMIRAYREAGYSTVFVTDHYQARFFDKRPELSSREAIDAFFLGYEEAKRVGDEIGVTVLFGIEAELDGCPNHYLVYGLTREMLYESFDIYKLTPDKLYEYAKARGLTVIQAHPNRDRKCYPTPDAVDGLEIYNSNPRHEDFSEEAEALARERGLLTSSGSDAHRPEDIARGGIISKKPILSVEEFINLLKSGDFGIVGRENDLFYK